MHDPVRGMSDRLFPRHRLDGARVTGGVTSIEVMPDQISSLGTNGMTASMPFVRTLDRRASTGARVTVEFVTDTPLPPHCEVRVCYDIAENGGWRECIGIPDFTHTTLRPGCDTAAHHYRLSYWIAPPYVMCFVQHQSLKPRAASAGAASCAPPRLRDAK
jgi:hypothetical protein